MKREPPSGHYRLEGNEEVLETGLLLQKMRAISLHALFAVVCLSLFCGLTSAPPRLYWGGPIGPTDNRCSRASPVGNGQAMARIGAFFLTEFALTGDIRESGAIRQL